MKSVWGKVYPFLPAGVWYAVIFWFSAQTGYSSGAMSDRLAGWLLRWWRPSFFSRVRRSKPLFLRQSLFASGREPTWEFTLSCRACCWQRFGGW